VDPSTRAIDATFAPPGEPWVSVSPVLATAYRLWLGLGVALVAIGAPFLLLIPRFPVWVVVVLEVVALVVLVWGWWLIGRRVRSWGYAERGDDLLVTNGFLFRRLVIVPYGRMQLVDLTAGPVHRAFGITTVQLHTAAATTDASIPGLRPDVAAGLRDRLARLGEQRSAGL
jgi:membrane protein YdbS with pleckstrin-like domain